MNIIFLLKVVGQPSKIKAFRKKKKMVKKKKTAEKAMDRMGWKWTKVYFLCIKRPKLFSSQNLIRIEIIEVL